MIVNETRSLNVASRLRVAQDPWQRMKGLLGTKALPPGEALVIRPCQSIHMLFMAYPIDVLFCDGQGKVVGLCADLRPFALSPVFFKAAYAIELPTGTIASSKTQLGDQIRIHGSHV